MEFLPWWPQKSKSPLLIAAGKGLESRVENLLARGVNINAQDAVSRKRLQQ